MKTSTRKNYIRYLIAFIFAGYLFIILNAFEPMRGVSWITPYDPVIWDGAATSWQEWAWASRYPNWFNDGVYPNAGFFYDQHKHGWQATSSSGNTAYYPGVVYFFAHDIEGEPPPSDLSWFRQRDDNDWNVAEYTYQGFNVKCWVFGGDDAQVDTGWIKLTDGLEDSYLIPEVGGYNLLNDAEKSFIVRFNNDPSTDVHWFPGNPEPGDPTWDWSQWYGFFASYGFNNSFFTTGIDPRPGYESDNEVYEWAFYWGHPGDEFYPPDTVNLPPGIGQPAPPVLDSTEILVVVIDPPKEIKVFRAPDWWIHFMPPFPPGSHGCSVSACQNMTVEAGQTVDVNFYIRNEGLEPDIYMGVVESQLGWTVEPSVFEISLNTEQWIIYPVKVVVPVPTRAEITDTIRMTLSSTGSPGLVKQDGMSITAIFNVGQKEYPQDDISLSFNTYPNPSRKDVFISYALPREADVKLRIFDITGQELMVIENQKKLQGEYKVKMDRNELQDGLYICRLEVITASGSFNCSKKILLFR
jgi:hypothetical protein